MTDRKSPIVCLLLCCTLVMIFPLLVSGEDKCNPPQTDTTFIDAQGTAHVTRVVPVPDTLSPEAQKAVAAGIPDARELYLYQSRRWLAGVRQQRQPDRVHAVWRLLRGAEFGFGWDAVFESGLCSGAE